MLYEFRPVREKPVFIRFTPARGATPCLFTIPVPENRDEEEFIDEYLESILKEDVFNQAEWCFA